MANQNNTLERELSDIENAQQALNERKNALREKMLGEVRRYIELFGFTAAELGVAGACATGKRVKKSVIRAAGGKQYRSPYNPSDVWGGRGPRPKWFTKALEEGHTLESMQIEK